MTITEKVAYLKGLSEGLELDANKEGKLFKVIIDVLDDIALTISDFEDGLDDISEQVDAIDGDLGNLEEDFYGDDEDDEDDFNDEDLYEVKCPSCGDVVCIDESTLDEGEMSCPNCKERLEFDFAIEDCDCDCCKDSE